MQSKNDLFNFRNEINNIDIKIVELLAKRKKLVLNIAQSKIKNNQPIRDIEREKNLLQKLSNLGKKHYLNTNYIIQLFKLIIEESVFVQKELLKKSYDKKNLHSSKICFLGPRGSYSYIAMLEYTKKKSMKFVEQEYPSLKKVILSVENNESDYAIIPIENSFSGLISESLNLLKKTNLFIIGEITQTIQHCLVATKNAELYSLRKIYSHSQPFQQCSNFIDKFPKWKIQYTNSTSEAMKQVAEYNSNSNAAIGSEIGAKIYGLKVLLKNLENHENNITKFIVLSKQPTTCLEKKTVQTTLIFYSTYNLKEIYKKLGQKKMIIKESNDHNIHSNIGKKIFYVDIKENISSDIVQKTLKKIKKITNSLKILGCYPINA